MSSLAPTDRPLRKDAERNRLRILDAAGELFAQRGLGVTLDDIARHAGVGVGTVYRRFADKELLIDALFEQRLESLCALAAAPPRGRGGGAGLPALPRQGAVDRRALRAAARVDVRDRRRRARAGRPVG